MKDLKIVFIFSLALLFLIGCSKEEIQPDPLTASSESAIFNDDSALKGAKAQNKFVPLKGSFEVSVFNRHPVAFQPPTLGQEIIGSGKMNHLGKTQVHMDQLWFPPALPPPPPPWTGTGEGTGTFTAANGDLLFITFTADSDHPVDKPVTVTYYCTIDGGTGRFEDAQGSFNWNGTYDGVANIGRSTLSEGKIMY